MELTRSKKKIFHWLFLALTYGFCWPDWITCCYSHWRLSTTFPKSLFQRFFKAQNLWPSAVPWGHVSKGAPHLWWEPNLLRRSVYCALNSWNSAHHCHSGNSFQAVLEIWPLFRNQKENQAHKNMSVYLVTEQLKICAPYVSGLTQD